MADDDDYAALGERIRALRLKARLTQAKLAENADISCVYVNKLERGLAVPSLQVLNRLARCLGVEVAALLTDGNGDAAAQPAEPKPNPYMDLYLSGVKRSVRNLVYETSDTPLPPTPTVPRKRR